MADARKGAEFAATWRNQDEEIVGTTHGGTMCWLPRKPWSLRIVDGDYSAIVPCGECPGCLEFYRRRLADRLKAKYGAPGGGQHRTPVNPEAAGDYRRGNVRPPLYLIRIYAPIDRHAQISRQLHRRRGLELEPGFIRLGASSFAVLSRSKVSPPPCLRRMGFEARIEPVRLSRGRRAWRAATGGLLVARSAYGENVNRWYLPGLPAAERKAWDVQTQVGFKHYKRSSSPRSWKAGNLVLVPPEIWLLGRGDRRTLRRDLGKASSPEGVARVMAMVSAVLARRSQSSILGPAARPVLDTSQVREFYAAMARRKAARASAPHLNSSSSLSGVERGYISSVHSGGVDPPAPGPVDGLIRGISPLVTRHIPQLPEDSLNDLTHKQYNKRRERRALDEHLEALKKRIEGRSGHAKE